MDTFYIIVIISVAGPIIGSLIGILKKPTRFFMNNMLAFAGGIMLTISFLELIPESIELSSVRLSAIGIILGAFIMYGLDKLIPHIHPGLCEKKQNNQLKRTSIYLIIGIFLHNFPEGMAIATGEVVSFKSTFVIALAIAVHNIPEGICTSAPYFYCTGKRLKAFLLSASTAIPILVGFLFAHFLFQNVPNNIIGLITAATAGLMIYISADELIPTSCRKHQKGSSSSSVFALIIGVLFVILLSAI